MAGSFGGTVKLTGESEYIRALKNISSNLKNVSSELKLSSTEFTNNGNKIGNLRTKNDALNKKLQEEQNIVETCTEAIKDFTEQQIKNKNEIDKLKSSLEIERSALDKMKNSTITTKDEIEKQEKAIANLEKELSKSESTYEANNRKINDYTVKMNDAKTECSNLSKEIQDNNTILSKTKDNFKDNSKSIKEFSDEEDKASNSTLKLGDYIKGNLISDGIMAGIKGMASAIKTVGSALVNLGKQAIMGYADYEQLIGGVETLFKDSAGVVENYANNAYKTSGLSANQYMETVTSFSASLLQSLNGDTAKSAEIADMAIIDMSDNANKMGTSMESIQNAYQGFAKQNYTMLDNLKLGYGGTKSEMERLLADAEKISGIKYDISNLSDVYSAIHIIQTELNITGTTAKEASTTISGSINSAKASWSNLITGIADENADFSQLVSNFVDSLIGEDGEGGVIGNLLPRITVVIDGLTNLIVSLADTLLPKLLEIGVQLVSNLVQGISTNLPSILTSVNQVITTLVDGIISMLPQILEMGIQIIISLIQGISQQLPTLIPQIVDVVVTMVDTLIDNIDLVINAGMQLIVSLAIGIVKAIPHLVSKVPEIISSLIGAITGYFGNLLNLGGQLIGKVKEGLSNGIESIKEVGGNIVKGLWNGISNAKDWVLDKIKGFGSSILNGLKSFFGIHSPSSLMRDEVGTFLAKGIGLGFEQEMQSVNKEIQDALPNDFDLSTNVDLQRNISSTMDTQELPSNNFIEMFKQALSEMKIMLDDEVAGKFVEDTVERVVYS